MVPALQALLGLLVVIALLIALALRYWRGRDEFAFVWWWRERKARKAGPPPVPLDPVAMFTPGTYDAAGAPCTTSVERIAELELPTGTIVACDPLTGSDGAPAFTRTVPPGRYPVDVCVAQIEPGHVRIAAIRVVFQPGVPVTWSPAETTGPDDLVDHGYGVDAGTGCFMDTRARDLLVASNHARLDRTDDDQEDSLIAELGDREWLDHHPAPDRSENVVIVHSGWGDGIYDSVWGLDASGKPVWLVTDFAVLTAPRAADRVA